MALTPTFPTQAITENLQTTFFLMSVGDGIASTIDVPVATGTPDGVAVLHGTGWDAANTVNESDINRSFAMDGTLTVNSLSVAVGTTLFINVHIKDIVGYLGEYTTAQRDALTPVGNPVIFNSETGNYERYEGGAWVNKTSNYSEAGISEDVFSQIKLTVAASGTGGGTGTNTDPITFDKAAWDAAFPARGYYPPGSTIDLSPFVGNVGGVGTLVLDETSSNTVNITAAQVSINQSTYIATFSKPLNTDEFSLEWGIA